MLIIYPASFRVHADTRSYFEEIHPCFPIVEEKCLLARLGNMDEIPQSFLCNLYASMLFYWDLSPSLARHPRPDQDLAWQVALAANLDDAQKQDLGTLVTTILNISGRPSVNLTGNTMNVARIVALSHGIGLNHDPTDWKISAQEKNMRRKLWWAVLIHDRWYVTPVLHQWNPR